MDSRKSKRQLAKEQRRKARPQPGPTDRQDIVNDLYQLETAMSGHIVFPWDPEYDRCREEFNPAYKEYPLAIAYCKIWEDVGACLAVARRLNLWTVCRAGGHSMCCYSVNTLGLVIDVSEIDDVYVDVNAQTATVGAGATFVDKIMPILERYGLHVPLGACPGVGVAGFMQGGGYGFTSRAYGMNCDLVLEVTVILADGTIVRANRQQNADLFWAIRGGTGNNFGVLLQIKYQLVPLRSVWGFGYRFALGDAPAALAKLQKNYTTSGAPNQLCYEAFLTTAPPDPKHPDKREPLFLVRGMYLGSREDGLKDTASLGALPGAMLDIDKVGPYSEIGELLFSDPPIDEKPPQTKGGVIEAGYVTKPVNVEGWAKLVDYFKSSPNSANVINFEAYGGVINKASADSNAFIHRDADMDVWVLSFWDEDDQRAAAEAWARKGIDSVLAPYVNGHTYQNYPNKRFVDYRWRYWGSQFDKLLKVKQKYDPTGFFRFEQGITPYPAGMTTPGALSGEDPPSFDAEIVREEWQVPAAPR